MIKNLNFSVQAHSLVISTNNSSVTLINNVFTKNYFSNTMIDLLESIMVINSMQFSAFQFTTSKKTVVNIRKKIF